MMRELEERDKGSARVGFGAGRCSLRAARPEAMTVAAANYYEGLLDALRQA